MRPKSNFIQISTGPIVPVMWPFAPATFESQAGTLIRSIVSRRCIKPSLFLTKKKNKEKKEIHNNVTKSAARIIELHGQYHRQSLIFPFAFHRPPSWSLFVNYMLINWSVGGCFVPHWHIRVATFFLLPCVPGTGIRMKSCSRCIVKSRSGSLLDRMTSFRGSSFRYLRISQCSEWSASKMVNINYCVSLFRLGMHRNSGGTAKYGRSS